ncbi:MAG: hypothetical protein WDO73_26985 [Ignavibacteriota bacterium]
MGKGTFPQPRRLTLQQLFTGAYDSQWVETEGVVQSVERAYSHIVLEMAAGLYPYMVHIPYPVDQPLPSNLRNATVRVRGATGTKFNERHQLIGVTLFAPALADIEILRPGIAPESLPVRAISSLLRFSPGADWQGPVRVQGTVEYQRLRSRQLYITDGGAGLLVQTEQDQQLRLGDRVNAVGFATPGEVSPALGDAIVTKLTDGPPAQPVVVDAREALSGNYDGQLIAIDAYLLSRVIQSSEQVMTFQAGDLLFTASVENTGAEDPLAAIRTDSLLRFDGRVPGAQPGSRPRAAILPDPAAYARRHRRSARLFLVDPGTRDCDCRLVWRAGLFLRHLDLGADPPRAEADGDYRRKVEE